ncbi:hypothetical protein [Haloferax sulfurifontis]|uniref:Uncharacterized protein n=1 Tax=Haloferax sulfurifontis TaxID=255616 RepID=A0A830DTH0_9EURY|nr:hypothetical protein [Haloferax sulfurifontis]GGC49776.1 hypothetical protein GCM10007209_09300 [Haloferax sulfurifontis]
MASNKHMLAKKTESYSDYLLFLIGALGFSGLVGAIVVTIFPAYSANGLIDLQSVLFSAFGKDVLLGAGLASGAGALAYGSNQTVDAITNVQDSWKETEGAAALVATGFPLAYTFLQGLQDAAAGSFEMQALFVAIYVVAFTHLVDL